MPAKREAGPPDRGLDQTDAPHVPQVGNGRVECLPRLGLARAWNIANRFQSIREHSSVEVAGSVGEPHLVPRRDSTSSRFPDFD
jgi:hypothetical protein